MVTSASAPLVTTRTGGAAYVFTETTTGNWVEEAKLVAPGGSSGDELGWSLDAGGFQTAIGARGGEAVHLFDRGGGGWPHQFELSAADGAAGDEFGGAVGFDDGQIVTGARQHDHDGSGAGAAYAFTVVGVCGIADYCFGSGDHTPCPCGNDADSREGCQNSTGSGATAAAAGSVSVTADDLSIHGDWLVPSQPALLFAGINAINQGDGVAFGDGLRCAGGAIERLGVRVPDDCGHASWGPGLVGQGGWGAGDRRRFQIWYRDPSGPCASGFNLTNGLDARFTP